MNYLDALTKSLEKEIQEGLWEVIEIRLRSESHNQLKKELETRSNRRIHMITSWFGIPVIVDDTIPSDRVWLIQKKEKEG